MIHNPRDESSIRIPVKPSDIDVVHIVDSWPDNLVSLNLEVSTGPVVPFRARQYLLQDIAKGAPSVPLLWMHNLLEMGVVWPFSKNGKAKAILDTRETKSLLLSVKNYVLLKRFSSKEQKRRLYASVLRAGDLNYPRVGLENHLNYIHRPGGSVSLYEAMGIAAILNTGLIDSYFRTLSGNTQVNATDIRRLPLPDVGAIAEIGKRVHENIVRLGKLDVDTVVTGVLGVKQKAS